MFLLVAIIIIIIYYAFSAIQFTRAKKEKNCHDANVDYNTYGE